MVHPHIGQLLLTQLTDYPKDIARAVAEHHERLDGSGYPHRLTGDKMSTLGKLLAATEEARRRCACRAPPAPRQRGPARGAGEFDELLAGPLSSAARHAPPMKPRRALPALLSELDRLNVTLQKP